MSKTVIKVENLSKQYRLGVVGTGTLSHDLNRWWQKVRGKEDPYLKIGETNDRAVKGISKYVWALKDINFDVKQGEVLGIIGKNGAGKSTLLKLLSRVTSPTTGAIKAKGRIASLLEVGTGFHPELTGRENIFLNGAILGMTKSEIKDNLEEIVEFSGTARYIDTPVKRYSSGMRVRLAFAVAAHLESEILIVDEVLAVGDAEFQKKAIGKMQDVSSGGGRTVLFVSHNMLTMQKLCKDGILMKNGKIFMKGTIQETIDSYLENFTDSFGTVLFDEKKDLEACIMEVTIEDLDGNVTSDVPVGKEWSLKVFYKVNQPVKNMVVAAGIQNNYEIPINTSWQTPFHANPGHYCAVFIIDKLHFAVGQYKIAIGLSDNLRSIQYSETAITLNIVPLIKQADNSILKFDTNTGLILNPMKMETIKN